MSPAVTNHQSPTRRALTLLELLVVVAILLLVSVTAIPVLIPSDLQKVRDAAITVNSMISRVKAAAARDDSNGRGMWLQPLDDGSGAVLDMFASQKTTPYQGDETEVARVYVYKPAGGKIAFPDGEESAIEFDRPAGMSVSDWQNTRLIFFPFFPGNQSCASVGQLCSASSRASIRGGEKYDFKLLPSDRLQTAHLPQPYRPNNFPCKPFDSPPYHSDPARHADKDYDYRHPGWSYAPLTLSNECSYVGVLQPNIFIAPSTSDPPYGFTVGSPTPLQSADVEFSIDRPNTRSPTPPLSLPSGYAIDLKWSGWAHVLFTPDFGSNTGAPVMGGFVPLNSLDPGQPLQLMFDSDGNLTELVYRRTSVIYGAPTVVDSYLTNLGDVFLLVGRADRCGMAFTEQDLTDPNVTGANWQYPDSRWIRISKTGGAVTISEPVPGARTLTESLKFALAGIAAGRG